MTNHGLFWTRRDFDVEAAALAERRRRQSLETASIIGKSYDPRLVSLSRMVS